MTAPATPHAMGGGGHPARAEPLAATRPLTIAVMAMGGQGGGVLVDWIVAMAERGGFVAQSTSVPGVAQRTGATIYYVEIVEAPPPGSGLRPVLSLMPVPGELDVVIGAELMEAGRAIMRGLVSPNRTTLIASSHRALAVSEKVVPGDGLGDADQVFAAAGEAAKRFLVFDMAAEAERTGSAISAVLFGALAASGALPFSRAAHEEAVREAGIGVEASLRAFAAGYDRVSAQSASGEPPAPPPKPGTEKTWTPLRRTGHVALDALADRVGRLPPAAQPMAASGLAAVVDFQDAAYGAAYLDLVEEIQRLDERQGGRRGHALTVEAAKYVALAMAYDDVVKVADLKTRASRFDRVRREVVAKPDQIVYPTEFMHPRFEEVCGALPRRLGSAILASPGAARLLRPLVDRGRRVRTGTVGWFLVLYAVAGLRRFRRGTLRHAGEMAHLTAWLDRVRAVAPTDYALAVELLRNRRLVKGYSDTHARGSSKFDRVMSASRRLEGRPDAAEWVSRLRKAALADEDGIALDQTIRTIDSFL